MYKSSKFIFLLIIFLYFT